MREGNGMVLGMSRERSTLATQARPPVAPERAGPVFGWDDWLIERGAVTWEGAADITGGFPGFASHGGRLDGCQVRVTERFLLVDEGRGHGFGLPLAWLIDADVLSSPFRGDRGETVLRVRYNDRDRARTFLFRFRGPFLALRGGRRAEHALTALRAVGLEAGSEALPPLPEIAHTWLEASRFEQENVIWSGAASASLGAGNELEPCDVWLTTRSVIWGGGLGDGVLRLPLERLLDVVSADLDGRSRTPALYMACLDDGGGRHDLPFIFDRQHPAQRRHRERGALIVGLRSRGIPLAIASAPPQPWRSALARVAATQEPVKIGLAGLTILASERRERRSSGSRPIVPETDDPAAWSIGPERRVLPDVKESARADDLDHLGRPHTLDHLGFPIRPFGRDGLTLVPRAPVEAESGTAPTSGESIGDVELRAVGDSSVASALVAETESPLSIVDAFEDAIVAVLIEAAQGIDRCLNGMAWTAPVMPVPSSSQQMAAHRALDQVATQGLLDFEEVRARRCRLVAAGEAGPRLRSLLELRLAGLITDGQLATKRSEIMAPLADVLRGSVG